MDRLARIGDATLGFLGRRWPIFGVALAVLLLVVALPFLFGWGLLRAPLQRTLSASLGRPVTIGSLARVDGVFHPLLEVGDLRIGQPAGIPGDMLRARRLRVRVSLAGLLAGRPNPQDVEIDGMVLRLVRLDIVRASWKGLPKGEGGGPRLRHLRIGEGRLIFDDRKRDHQLRATFTVDDAGLRLAGGGTLIGRPVRIALAGPAVTRAGAWPFRLDYRSPIVSLALRGVADHPLDLGHFTADAVAQTDSLEHLDLLIEAGLPATAPTRLTARVRQDRPDWKIERLRARMGRTEFATALAIVKHGARTRIDGKVQFDSFHPDDFADAQGLATAAAKRASAGPRLLPDTAIDLRSLAKVDGRLDVRIARLALGAGGILGGMHATMTLDDGVLTADPLSVQIGPGRLAGTARVTQRGASTRLALDLRLTGTRVGGVLASSDALSGTLAGRVILAGEGGTVRAALGHANGRFALVARDGAIGRRIALLLGQDAGRALFAGGDGQTTLRCAIASFRVANGTARPAPLLIDTDVAQANAAGSIDLASERVHLTLTGAPKQASALRLSGPIQITGPLAAPQADAPGAASVGGILKSIGRAIRGDNPPLATNADCAGLTLQALR